MRILIALAALLSFSLAQATSLDDILSAPHRSAEEKRATPIAIRHRLWIFSG